MKFCDAFSASSPLPTSADNNRGPLHDEERKEREIQHLAEVGRKQLQGLYNFPLDDWQLQAGGAIWEGHNVIVSAPTGAGK